MGGLPELLMSSLTSSYHLAKFKGLLVWRWWIAVVSLQNLAQTFSMELIDTSLSIFFTANVNSNVIIVVLSPSWSWRTIAPHFRSWHTIRKSAVKSVKSMHLDHFYMFGTIGTCLVPLSMEILLSSLIVCQLLWSGLIIQGGHRGLVV